MGKSPKIYAPRITVAVTREIIDLSERRNSSHCMIAEAVKRSVPEARHVSVDLATIRFTDPNKRLRYIYLTPRKAQYALLDFDQGHHAEPFEVQLRAAQVVRSGAGRERRGATRRFGLKLMKE